MSAALSIVEQLAAVPAHKPDVTIIHAQKADRQGNVLLWGVAVAIIPLVWPFHP